MPREVETWRSDSDNDYLSLTENFDDIHNLIDLEMNAMDQEDIAEYTACNATSAGRFLIRDAAKYFHSTPHRAGSIQFISVIYVKLIINKQQQ